MDLNKHIVTDDSGVFHSNGYARVANDGIGATDPTSFEKRQLVEYNRRLVNNYRRSAIGSMRSGMGAKPITPDLNSRQLHVNERPPRQYNPYA